MDVREGQQWADQCWLMGVVRPSATVQDENEGVKVSKMQINVRVTFKIVLWAYD